MLAIRPLSGPQRVSSAIDVETLKPGKNAKWWSENFVNAVKELGIGIAQDQANGSPIGGFYTPHNQDPTTVTRSSAREAYYNTVQTRTNLHLITGERVTRIATNKTGETVQVTGVEVSCLSGSATGLFL
jgi:choline dehydrogenase-like flavoprotein